MAAEQSTFPTVIKHYRLDRELGRGAMGAVYQGEDRRDGTRVAVKLLHPHLGGDEEFRARFEREAHVAALLRSPYTVHLIDFGLTDGSCYLVMEFIEGKTLADLIREAPLEPARALRIATEIARALEESGARGVVHRDIKPENVLLDTSGRVKVTDFGIARQSTSAMTSIGAFVGTPAYAAPEQSAGEVDGRADIYALGATLYTMLTGHPPYRGTSMFQVLEQHRTASLPMQPLAHVPDAVSNVIRRCMEKDPRDRYATASELVGALERASATLSGGGRTLPIQLSSPPPVQPPVVREAPPPVQAPPVQARPPSPPPAVTRPPQPSSAPTVVGPSSPSPSPLRGTGIVTARPQQSAPQQQPQAQPRTAPPAIRMALVRTAPPARDGTAPYELSITNDATAIALLRLVSSDPAGTLQITAPARTVVTPGATVILEVSVAPRIRRTSGPERQLSFALNGYDENSGQAVGSATGEYIDLPAPKGHGYGRLLILGILGGLLIAAAAGGGLALLDRGKDENGGRDLTGTPPDGAIRPGIFDYNFVVEENTCAFGANVGQEFSLSFRFANTSPGFIEDRDQVVVTFLGSGGNEARVGRSTFDFDAFEFSYNPAKAGDSQGRATVETSFADAETIGSATYTEAYDLGTGKCVITAKQ